MVRFPDKKLTPRELRFLNLIHPMGTIAVGLRIGYELCVRGYIQENKDERYEITRKGMMAVSADRVRCRPK